MSNENACLVDEFLLAFGIRTAVRSLARVGADVLVEDGLLPEAFGALRAHVRLLARVDPDVLVQDRLLPEGLQHSKKKKKKKKKKRGSTVNPPLPYRVKCIRGGKEREREKEWIRIYGLLN